MDRNCRGQLKNWKDGYGFIKFEENGRTRDVFVHRKAYLPGFEAEIGQVGQTLAFDFVEGPDGKPPMAGNVRVVTSAGAHAEQRKIKEAVETLLKLVGPNRDTAETLRTLIAPKQGAV